MLYIAGMICLVISMALLVFSAYIFPFLLFNWVYDVPEFVLRWRQFFQVDYGFSLLRASWGVFCVFFIPALIMALLAYVFSHRIDAELHGVETPVQEKKEKISLEVKATTSILSKIIFTVILVFIIVTLFEWLIYIPPVG